MSTFFQDLRYAARLLLRQPVFTAIALLTLALGIGANTAIFSIIDTVLLHPLPYPDAGRLVRIWTSEPSRGKEMEQSEVSLPRYEAIRDGQSVFAEIAASAYHGGTITGRGEPLHVHTVLVSARFFQTLGVTPAPGRTFLPEEDRPGGGRVAVVSRAFWQKHLGGDPALVGQSLTLDDTPCTVIGILPAPLSVPYDDTDVFLPGVRELPGVPEAQVRQGTGILNVTARLKPGVSLERADEEVRLLAARYRQAFPAHVDASAGIKVIPFQEEVVGQARPTFYTLAGAVGCVLLIACVNVANLVLARLAGRRKEIAIRAALGAGNGRLWRQFLTESLLLALLAGVLGALLALWGVDLVHGLGPESIPRAEEVHLSLETLGFTLAVSVFTGLLLGSIPAWHAARGGTGADLQEGNARGAAGGVTQGRARAALLVAQVAMSLVLLAGTGLLLTSLWRLQHVPMGFQPEGVLTAGLTLPRSRYPEVTRQADFFDRLQARLAALPGVRSAAAGTGVPLGSVDDIMFYSVVGQPVPPIEQRPSARADDVSPGYFATLGIALRRGRDFNERDRADTPPVMMISESMAQRLFPNVDPLGQHLLCTASNPTVTEIVGVVAGVRSLGPAQPAPDEMYFPMSQRGGPFAVVLVRAATPALAAALEPGVRAAVRELDSSQPVNWFETMDVTVARAVADRRLMAWLLAGFAALALVLAAVGIYGVTAYGVVQRTREIGIRMALGAQRGDVLRLIIGGGMRLTLAGVALGVLAALGLTRLLASLLYGVGASDPATFIGVVGLLGAVALVANYLPARRATRIDPMVALREE